MKAYILLMACLVLALLDATDDTAAGVDLRRGGEA